MSTTWEARRDRYREIVESADLEFKGKSVPYTSANGHMFSQLNKDAELGVRLSKDDQAWFDETYGAEEFRSYGSVMRDYVLVPADLWEDSDAIADLLHRAHEYVMSLASK